MANGFIVNVSVEENGRNRPEYSLDTDLDGEISLEDLLKWLKTTLIITADQTLRDEQSLGFDQKPIITVDGRLQKPILEVSPVGSIEFTSRQNISAIIIDAYKGILSRSKVLTGLYKASHYVFLSGTQVATDLAGLEAWFASGPKIEDRDVIRIVNIQPYARRLERLGVTAQRSNPKLEDKGRRKGKPTGKRFLVPNGAYQLTARSMKTKYKQNIFIKFTFMPGNLLGLRGTFKKGRAGRNSAGRPYLYPTLAFYVQERGITP